MRQKIRIAVLGGGGRTGKYVVTELLRRGYQVKALLRNPEPVSFQNPDIEIIKGDALDPESIKSTVFGCQAVISTLGQRKDEPLVASQATTNVLNARSDYLVDRYILVAGINIDTPFDKKGAATIAATEWMKSNFPAIQADRQNAYCILSASDANWTLVRVPFIEFIATAGETVVSLEDCLGQKIAAADIATFLVDQLDGSSYKRKSPFISNG